MDDKLVTLAESAQRKFTSQQSWLRIRKSVAEHLWMKIKKTNDPYNLWIIRIIGYDIDIDDFLEIQFLYLFDQFLVSVFFPLSIIEWVRWVRMETSTPHSPVYLNNNAFVTSLFCSPDSGLLNGIFNISIPNWLYTENTSIMIVLSQWKKYEAIILISILR